MSIVTATGTKIAATDKNEIAYRPDIDGLRAVAVSLVLLSHVGVPHFQGGFIGVDIFFVISGYLITGNIAQGIARGHFSLLGFYERRFRRIVPALMCMLLGTTLIASLVFLPSDLVAYTGSMLSAVFSYSNLYFYWTKSGYFGLNYTNILLHTWSLGVEEQFYLLIPICMMIMGSRDRLRRMVFALVSLVSLLLAAYFAFKNRDLAFYMPYTRAWELLCGSMLALGLIKWTASARFLRELLCILSLVLVAICTWFYNQTTPFPGVTALPPCLAAVTLIKIGERGATAVTSVLSSPPMRFVGTISYSLYLWHWPVIVLVRLGAIPGVRDRSPSGYLFVLVASFVLAWLSWRFVEQPFRFGRFKKTSGREIFALAGASALVFVFGANVLRYANGFPHRFPAESLAVASYLNVRPTMQVGSCFLEGGFAEFDKAGCLTRVSGRRNFLLFGDSHAADLWWGLRSALPQDNIMQATLAACPPQMGSYGASDCSKMRKYIYGTYLPQNPVDAVLLSERWTSLHDVQRLEPALEWLQGHGIPVYIVGPVPEYNAPLPYLLALGLKRHDPGLASRNQVNELQRLDQEMQVRLAGRHGVTYASAWKAICSAKCAEYADPNTKVPMLSDVDHLTDPASIKVVHTLLEKGELPR